MRQAVIKLTGIILALVAAVVCFTSAAFAETDAEFDVQDTIIYTNPVYGNLISESELIDDGGTTARP